MKLHSPELPKRAVKRRPLSTRTALAFTLPDFSVLRAVVSGISLREAAALYWGSEWELREIKSKINLLLDVVDEFATHDNIGKRTRDALSRIRQVVLNAREGSKSAQKRSTSTTPNSNAFNPDTPPVSFDTFYLEYNPSGFWSMAEVEAEYAGQIVTPWKKKCEESKVATPHPVEAAEPIRSALSRDTIDEILDSIKLVQGLVSIEPKLDDVIGRWVSSVRICKALKAKKIRTVGDLVNRINVDGINWGQDVKGIGARHGRQLIEWLQKIAPGLGVEISRTSLLPIKELRSAVANSIGRRLGVFPLERVLIPQDFAGIRNSVDPRCALSASNDMEAIEAYLAMYKSTPTTWRAKRGDVEKLLLWCVAQRSVSLSSMKVEDAQAYAEFLSDPQPPEKWIYAKRCTRTDPKWRPFQKALKGNSWEQTLGGAAAFLRWLHRVGYVQSDPFAGVRGIYVGATLQDEQKQKKGAATTRDKRTLELALWERVEAYFTSLDVSSAQNARTVAVMLLGQRAGLRADEIVRAQVGDIVTRTFEDENEYHELTTRGKGRKQRTVRLSNEAYAALDLHVKMRGFGDGVSSNTSGDVYLIGSLKIGASSSLSSRAEGVTYSVIYATVKQCFHETLQDMKDDPELSSQMKRQLTSASTHWLRHSFASQALQNGVPLEMLADMMGHNSVDTTKIYTAHDGRAMAKQQQEAEEKMQERMLELRAKRKRHQD